MICSVERSASELRDSQFSSPELIQRQCPGAKLFLLATIHMYSLVVLNGDQGTDIFYGYLISIIQSILYALLPRVIDHIGRSWVSGNCRKGDRISLVTGLLLGGKNV